MYEHTFVKIELTGGFKLQPKTDYRKIVYEYEKEGWELVQIFAPGTKQHGLAEYFELIFKRIKQE